MAKFRFNVITLSDPFEKRLFDSMSLIIAVVTCYLIVQGIINESRTLTLSIISGVMVFGLTNYILSRRGYFKPFMVVSTIVLLYGIMIFFWFWISGINGPTGIGMISVIALSYILLPGKYRYHLAVFNTILLLFLALSHYLYPELIPYGELSYPTMPIEYIIFGMAHTFFVFYLQKEVDSEQTRVRKQNRQLSTLNSNLSSTVDAQLQTLRKLSATRGKLMESEKMASLGHLTAGLVHEINNPLNYVGGVVHPLKEGLNDLRSLIPVEKQDDASKLSGEIEELLESIENGTQMASDIMKRLQNISRGDTELVTIKISSLLSDVVRLVEKSSYKIQFEKEIEDELYISGNALELNQVILNLLRNAVQAIPEPEKGFISVVAQSSDENVIISISDNGVGMESETIQRAFDPFYTTKKDQGTGLGLYISSEIVKKHKGTIAVKSDPGKRTIFTLMFPKSIG